MRLRSAVYGTEKWAIKAKKKKRGIPHAHRYFPTRFVESRSRWSWPWVTQLLCVSYCFRTVQESLNLASHWFFTMKGSLTLLRRVCLSLCSQWQFLCFPLRYNAWIPVIVVRQLEVKVARSRGCWSLRLMRCLKGRDKGLVSWWRCYWLISLSKRLHFIFPLRDCAHFVLRAIQPRASD